MSKHLAGALLALSLSTSASAAVIFEDNFDSEAGLPGQHALNYNSFSNWSVTNGTVDVVSSGGWGISCVDGTGKCVDLDGSTGDAGIFTSSALTLGPGDYLLSFDISGNQRNHRADSLAVTLGGFFSDSYDLASNSPWTTITHAFTVAAATTSSFVFNHSGGDNIGIMLDNVSLHSVEIPEPSSILIFGLGLFGLGLARRNVK
ncbi:MAG: PEP-CTERM sorting domain-containing protein [Pseudomonadales bacterium]|nr:PEP-CTERM sorting domain-containing protein [Pseudomonadales bacterium]